MPYKQYLLMEEELSMSDIISVSRSEVTSTANQFLQKQNELETIMQQVQHQIGTMSTWRGDAQVNFVSLMEQWNQQIVHVHTLLGDVSKQLKQFEDQIGIVDTSTRF